MGHVGHDLCPRAALGRLVLPHSPPQCPEQCLAHSKHSINVCVIELDGLYLQVFLPPLLFLPPSLSLSI